MEGYHNIYLQFTVTITSTYNDSYHMTYSNNCWFPQHLLAMNGYHYIYLQGKVTISYTYNMGGYHTIY